LPAQHRLLPCIYPMQLKKMLRRIHPNADNLVHGRLPCLRFATTSFWHTDAVGGRPHHHAVPLMVAGGASVLVEASRNDNRRPGLWAPAFAGATTERAALTSPGREIRSPPSSH